MLNDLFYNCINSKDIRKYLKELDYQFSPLEAAWLVWQCRAISIKEKYKLWQQIIDTMADCIIKKHLKEHADILYNSLHDFLNEYMDLQNEYIERFNLYDKISVYQFELTWGVECYINRYNTEAYSTIDKCFDRAMAVCAEYTEEDEKPLGFRIKKLMTDSKSCYIEANYLPDGMMAEITPHGYYDKKDEIYTLFEDNMCFSFPVPFRKGDILWNPWMKHYTCGPVVLESIAAKSIDGSADRPDHNRIRKEYSGDISDMDICGIFQQEDGDIFEDNIWCYMDYEFYPEEKLVGEKRILKLIGAYLKDEISITLFTKGCWQIMDEFHINNNHINFYTSDILKKVGLRRINNEIL